MLTLKAPPIICSRRQFQILLLEDDSHEISYLIFFNFFFLKIKKDVAEIVVCCSRDWRFLKGLKYNIGPIQELFYLIHTRKKCYHTY